MTEGHERELDKVRRARAEFEASQDEVERRKQDYFTAVRTLHEAGMPLREIANALGLSHQRVHQMVEEATGKKNAGLRRKAARTARQGGLALLLMALGAGGFVTLTRDPEPNVERVSEAPARQHRAPRRDHPMPDMPFGECAIKIFRHHDRTKDELGHGRTFTLKPECVIEEVRVRTTT